MTFKLQSLAELCRQMRYTPRERRLRQLRAAEDLLLRVDPDKAYPPGYVVHAITGYRPKHADVASAKGGSQMTGVALRHDLGLLVETVSDAMDLAADDPGFGGEPILDLATAGERFGVTGKTLQRWRRKGLPARRLVFPDGKKRVAFRLECVERFLRAHESGATAGAGGGAILDAERDRLVDAAVTLGQAGHDRREVVLRLARRFRRSTLEVRSALEADGRRPLEACVEPLDDGLAGTLSPRISDGRGIFAAAREMRRPASAVYRAVMLGRAEEVAAATVKYHHDELFEGPAGEAEARVNALVKAADEAVAAGRGGMDEGVLKRPPRGVTGPLGDLFRRPVLSPAQERAGFLLYNYHKYRFARLRRRFEPCLCRRRTIGQMERHLRLARDARNKLIEANLRLVVHVARKHLRPGLDLADLVSDGNVVLMRAVEGFDVAKGFKFSTYATLALMKGYARSVPELQAGMATPALGAEPAAPAGPAERFVVLDELDRLLAELEPRERRVVAARWELDSAGQSDVALADDLGLSTRRLRQIESDALGKMRAAAESGGAGGN